MNISRMHNQAQHHAAGIPSQFVDRIADQQRMPNWCWAASIQMLLNLYGIVILQEDIVARSIGVYPNGTLPDKAAERTLITSILNGPLVDRNGRHHILEAWEYQGGAPRADHLHEELSQGYPMLAGYNSGQDIGHIVLIENILFDEDSTGRHITKVIVRDPSPTYHATVGQVALSGIDFENRITTCWYVRVRHLEVLPLTYSLVRREFP